MWIVCRVYKAHLSVLWLQERRQALQMEIDKASQPEKTAKPSVSINSPEKRIKPWHFALTLKGYFMYYAVLHKRWGTI